MNISAIELDRLQTALDIVHEAASALVQVSQPEVVPEEAKRQVTAILAELREIVKSLQESDQDFEDRQLAVFQFKSEVGRLKQAARTRERHFRQGTYLLDDAAHSVRAEALSSDQIRALEEVLRHLGRDTLTQADVEAIHTALHRGGLPTLTPFPEAVRVFLP